MYLAMSNYQSRDVGSSHIYTILDMERFLKDLLAHTLQRSKWGPKWESDWPKVKQIKETHVSRI